MAMSEAHKAAIKKGRAEAEAVKRYLETLGSKGGRRASRETLQRRLNDTKEALAAETNTLKHLDLVQKKEDVEKALRRYDEMPDHDRIERDFIQVAKAYGDRKGISYKAWRAVGVPAALLKSAGVKRTRG